MTATCGVPACRPRGRLQGRHGLDTRRKANRPHSSSGGLRQCLLRRPQAQSALYGREPVALCSLRQHPRGGARLAGGSPSNWSSPQLSLSTFTLRCRVCQAGVPFSQNAGSGPVGRRFRAFLKPIKQAMKAVRRRQLQGIAPFFPQSLRDHVMRPVPRCHDVVPSNVARVT